ncbi:coiled-coil domain-containing protein 93 [Chelonus insularis]|uniref:coiled-coil domain-containing protein 93 n=1 Tax=Chelonus insularis TaxID=460826 RepID=UPI00158BC589|nr:coiled-coil domain-containing protein 93 [Chelonus insularis]
MSNTDVKRSMSQSYDAKADIRKDEEQIVELNKIVDLLVAAGYFRARIKGLSDFDKVVGGITWCIESCNYDVNINFLFHENLTIGQKIALTEKIVIILPKMNCPHRIEPHQIQGLDCIHIFPVIQWLLKRTIEARKEIAGYVRSFIEHQFDKIHANNNKQVEADEPKTNLAQQLHYFRRIYEPRPQLKDNLPVEQIKKLKYTLFEYGMSEESALNDINTSNRNQENTPTEVVTPSVELSFKQPYVHENHFNASTVGKILSLHINEVTENSKLYTSYKTQDTHNKSQIFETIQKQKNILQQQVATLEENKKTINKKLNNVTEHLLSNQRNQQIAHDNCIELKKLTYSNHSTLQKIRSLFLLRMNLKAQEHAFREQCLKNALYLNEIIVNVDTRMPEEHNSLTDYDTIKKSIDKTKLILAKKNRTLASLARQLDDVPGRSELAQYQRRFMELYNQVSATHKETKQYYTLYNTLYDTKLYLSKEFSLLNSIQDNYKEAMTSVSGKEEFLKQFETISLGVKRNKKKLEEKYAEEKNKTYLLNKQLAMITEQQRKYVTAVKQLTIECRRNEALLARLRTNQQ